MFKIFGKHYGTERFFILLFVLFGLIISLFIYAGTIQHKRNQFSLGSTPLYTSNYRWSRTSAEGNVVKMLSNSRNACSAVSGSLLYSVWRLLLRIPAAILS